MTLRVVDTKRKYFIDELIIGYLAETTESSTNKYTQSTIYLSTANILPQIY